MTFQEWTAKNPQGITAPIDDNLRQCISDWFDYRHICDDEMFGVYINRVLNRDYGRYCELLRVQARTADNQPRYDWLVGNYNERQTNSTTDTSGSTEQTSEQSVNGSTSGSRTDGGTDETAHTGTVKQDGGSTRETISHSADSGKDVADHKKGTTTSHTGNTETKNNQTHTNKQSGSPQTVTNHYTGNQGASKTGPMDAGVASQGSVTLPAGMGTIPGISVDFGSHASQIQQTQTDDKQMVQETLDTTTTDTYGGTADTQSTTGSDSTTGTDTDTTTYGKVTDGTGSESGTTTSTQTDDRKDTTTYGRTETSAGTNESKTTGKGSTTNSESTTGQIRERYTGRSEAPADIMARAVVFIESSSAWQWIEPRINACFQSIYDI